jgi:general secretion pathway protein K
MEAPRQILKKLPFARSRRGSVVVVVLIIIMFAAMLLGRLIELSSTDLLIAMRVADRERLRADARAGLETTLAVLQDFQVIDRALYSPTQGWSDPLGYAGYVPREGVTLEVTFEDESAKLSLPKMNLDTLLLLLTEIGLAPNDADRVADGMMGWMHKEHVAGEAATSANVYLQDALAHEPPHRSLRSFDELADIAVAREFFYDLNGRPTQLWTDFVANVSLYNFESTNLNSASPTVMAASGWDDSQVKNLGTYLSKTQIATTTPPYLRSMNEVRQQVGNAANRNLGTEIQVLRVNVIARQGAAQLKLSALICRSGQAKLPPPVSTEQIQTTEEQATEGQKAASPTTQAAQRTNTAGNSINYPFTILELTETSLPDAVPSPDSPTTTAASVPR